MIGSEASPPVDLEFCVDREYQKFTIALGLISSVSLSEELTDTALRPYLDEISTESRRTVTLSSLEILVQQKKPTVMKNINASSCMRKIFIDYYSLLRQQGIPWVIKSSKKIAVHHEVSAVRPTKFKSRMESDLYYSYAHIKEDLKNLFEHGQKITDAFALVDNGSTHDDNAE